MSNLETANVQGETKPARVTLRPARTLFSNSLAMAASNLLGRGVGYLYIILMARRLDARYVGAYAILTTASMLLDLVSNLGLDKILIREIASGPVAFGNGIFWAALPIRFAMASAGSIVTWSLLLTFFNHLLFANPFSIALYLSAIFPVIAARNCEAFLVAHERLFPIAVAQLSERLVIFCAVLLLCSGVITFENLICFTPLASLARLLIVAYSTTRRWQPAVLSQRPAIRGLVRQAAELFSVEILALVYFRSDVFLLAKMGGLRETGVYQVTYKIFDCCLSLFSGFLQASFPRLVIDKSRQSLKTMLAGGTVLLMIPVAVIILARHLILGALKPEYLTGSTSLVWLMLTVPLVYITSTLANAAIAAGQVKILIKLAGLLIFTNVSLNVLLIPKWSISGAAFSTFACELVSAAILGPFLFRALTAVPVRR